MFNIHIPSQETYKIHLRPAIYQSLATVLEYFNIHQKHKIYFNGEGEVSKLIGGLYNSKRGDDIDSDLGYDDKIFVEVEIDYGGFNDELDSENKGGQTVPPLWVDPITGSMIRPVYTGRRVDVTINKFFKDRTTAQTFHRNIRSGLLQSNLISTFDVNTHYPIPMSLLECYQDVYKRLLNGKAVDEENGKNFLSWFRGNSTVETDIISNIVGNNNCLVFLQQNADNGMNYGPVNFAQVNKGRYIGQFEVSWTYSFFWNEHTKWSLEYPIQVFQQQMPGKWIPDQHERSLIRPPSNRFLESTFARAVFGAGIPTNPFYHVLPNQDNWRPPTESWLSPQLQILVNMEDVQGEQVILNIKDIHGFTWDEKFLKYILQHHTKVTRRHRSPLNFKVWSNNTQVLESQIELRENGDLVITRPPTLSNIYRVVFSLDYALRQYTDDGVWDILDDGEYGRWIIDTLFPGNKLPDTWPHGGWNDWIEIHNKIEVGDGPEIDYFSTYMMGMVVIAKREGNLY